MGDRANVYVKQAEVYLYSHWGGWHIAAQLRDALKSAPGRWDDDPYLTRIIFREMGGGEVGETGYGISHTLGDNERPILVVDCDEKTVSHSEAAPVPFSKFIEMSDEEVRTWHLGRDD